MLSLFGLGLKWSHYAAFTVDGDGEWQNDAIFVRTFKAKNSRMGGQTC